MEFVWDMTESEWNRLIGIDAAKATEDGNDCFGNCYVGALVADVMHTFDTGDWCAFTNIFGLGIDDGYGYTPNGNIPYCMFDDFFRVNTKLCSFDAFKKDFENNFKNVICKNSVLSKLANSTLGDWK